MSGFLKRKAEAAAEKLRICGSASGDFANMAFGRRFHVFFNLLEIYRI